MRLHAGRNLTMKIRKHTPIKKWRNYYSLYFFSFEERIHFVSFFVQIGLGLIKYLWPALNHHSKFVHRFSFLLLLASFPVSLSVDNWFPWARIVLTGWQKNMPRSLLSIFFRSSGLRSIIRRLLRVDRRYQVRTIRVYMYSFRPQNFEHRSAVNQMTGHWTFTSRYFDLFVHDAYVNTA